MGRVLADDIADRFSGNVATDGSCFWSLAGTGYRDGLARMAELTHDATAYKLPAFCELLLARDPHDVRAHWTVIGYDVACCSNSITERSWRALFAPRELIVSDVGHRFEARWLAEHAYWVLVVSGKDTSPLLGDLLRRHRLLEVVRPALRLLSIDETSEQWVTRVIAAASAA